MGGVVSVCFRRLEYSIEVVFLSKRRFKIDWLLRCICIISVIRKLCLCVNDYPALKRNTAIHLEYIGQ